MVDAKVPKTFGGNPRAGSSPALATDRKIKDTYSNLILSIKLLIWKR